MIPALPQHTPYDQALAYVLSRQSAAGGFCFYRSEYVDEPNLADTYHAVRTLQLLGAEVPGKGKTAAFIRDFLTHQQTQDRYHSAFALCTLDRDFYPAPGWLAKIAALSVSPPPLPDSSILAGWLARTRKVSRLKRQFSAFAEADIVQRQLLGLERPDGGFGIRSNIRDTWLALDILTCCDGSTRPTSTTAFVDRLQTPTYGFDTIEGAVSGNLDSVFAGVRCCHLLGIPIKHAESVRSFVLACQGAKGGFARAPGALPDIAQTHAAIWTLCRLTESAKPMPDRPPREKDAHH